MPDKASARQKAQSGRRVLDEYARRRRQRRQLDALEMDNFGDDPHANLAKAKKLPSFIDSPEEKKKKKKKGTGEHFKQRFKKTFVLLLEEEKQEFVEGEPNYVTACVPPSKFPERHFCSVCGFPSNYTCVQCGSRYCCVKCLGTHQDTRYKIFLGRPTFCRNSDFVTKFLMLEMDRLGARSRGLWSEVTDD